MSTTGDFLKDVLDEYEDILNKNPKLRTAPDPGIPLTRRICRSLEEVKNLDTAMKWLQKQPKTECPPEERSYYLYLLLSWLDEFYSTRRLTRAKTSQGEYIVLGQRWWRVYAKHVSSARLLAGQKRSAYSGFPHLRDVKHSDEEWFRSKQLDEAFRSAVDEGFLRVGLCSLSGESRTQFEGTRVLDAKNDIYGFRSTCIVCGQGSDYTQELRECVKWARDNKIHVLCFPELSVCPDGRQAIWSEIEKAPGQLCLVIPGSYHDKVENGEDFWVNAAPIWLVTSGKIIELTTFEKTEPFPMKTSDALGFSCICDAAKEAEDNGCECLKEHIRPGDMLRVLNTPMGMFGIMICRDQLMPQESGPKLVERYSRMVDHLLVISMNYSRRALFWSEAEKVAHTRNR